MWDYLEHMALLLSNIGEVLRVMPRSEAKLVRHGLSSASRRYTSFGKQLSGKTPRTKSIAVPFVTGDDGNLLPGMCMCNMSCVCVHVVSACVHVYMHLYAQSKGKSKCKQNIWNTSQL